MSQRLDRINELMKREISTVVMKEFEFPNCLVTISEVVVTQDLQEAKVFVSVLGGDPQSVITKLRKRRGMIQGRTMKRVVLRCTPILDFRIDTSADRGVSVVNLLDEVARLETAEPEEEGSDNTNESK